MQAEKACGLFSTTIARVLDNNKNLSNRLFGRRLLPVRSHDVSGGFAAFILAPSFFSFPTLVREPLGYARCVIHPMTSEMTFSFMSPSCGPASDIFSGISRG